MRMGGSGCGTSTAMVQATAQVPARSVWWRCGSGPWSRSLTNEAVLLAAAVGASTGTGQACPNVAPRSPVSGVVAALLDPAGHELPAGLRLIDRSVTATPRARADAMGFAELFPSNQTTWWAGA
jgi:hypothetical protein